MTILLPQTDGIHPRFDLERHDRPARLHEEVHFRLAAGVAPVEDVQSRSIREFLAHVILGERSLEFREQRVALEKQARCMLTLEERHKEIQAAALEGGDKSRRRDPR